MPVRAVPPLRRGLGAAAGRRLLLGGLFVVMAVGMTFQNPTRLLSHFPGNMGDSVLLDWIMSWDAHALLTDPLHAFDAPIYWPRPNTLVYSDTLFAAAPVHWVLKGVFGWPLGFNLHYLLGGVLSLVGAYLLARWFTRDTAASVLAAIVFSFAAVRLSHYGHFQFTYAYLVPFTLWLLLRFLTERERGGRAWAWQAGGVGLAWSAAFLNVAYLALALIPAVAVVVGGWLVAERFRPGPRFWPGVAVAAVVAAALCGPVAYRFQLEGDALSRGFHPEYAAHPGDFLAPGVGTYLYGPLERWADRGHEHRLFPGLAALGLGTVGLVALARRRLDEPGAGPGGGPGGGPGPGAGPGPGVGPAMRRRALWLLVIAGAVVAVLSLGRWQTVAGRRISLPYSLVADLGPGFDSVRAFGRFTVVSLAVLAVLVAVGFRTVARRWRPVVATGAAVAVGAFMLVEYAIPIGLERSFDDPRHTAVNHALDRLPDGAVLELPMGDAPAGLWAFVEPARMRFAMIDWHPRVNGYSGYFPPGYLTTVELLNSFVEPGPPRPEAVARLDELGVRYVVLRTAPVVPHVDVPGVVYYTPEQVERVLEDIPPERIEAVSEHGAAVLVQLHPAQSLSR